MRRILPAALILATLLPGCASGSAERVVRVDYRQDEFASHYWRYFPSRIYAHPGDTLEFRQEWTGEPHTVTFGTIVDDALLNVTKVERRYERYEQMAEDDVPRNVVESFEEDYEAALDGLPLFDPYTGASAQNAQQSCYLREGKPPTDPDVACPKREQPAFDGRYAYHSSGFIPPHGPRGNVHRVELDDDTPAGTYGYVCVIHFPEMQGSVVVKERGEALPSDSEVRRRARSEIEDLASPLRDAFEKARAGRAEYVGEELDPPLGGFHAAEEYTVAIDEFFPKTHTVRVNEPVTWTLIGAHTVSFDVPSYLPIYIVDADGTVERNRKVDEAAGGSPKAPAVDFARHKLEIDGGTWDGSGFISSGLLGSEPYSKYTLRVSTPGRYRYACLVHPKMVATLVVED
jgi:plastocyanin